MEETEEKPKKIYRKTLSADSSFTDKTYERMLEERGLLEKYRKRKKVLERCYRAKKEEEKWKLPKKFI